VAQKDNLFLDASQTKICGLVYEVVTSEVLRSEPQNE
jgi:hypothetical protein